MKKIILTVCCMISMLIPFIATAQSYYGEKDQKVWKKQIQVGDIKYSIIGNPLIINVENSQNSLLHQRNYKLDSNPRIYYSEADGRCELAEVDEGILLDIERNVFSDFEIDDYTDNPGYIYVTLAVNPGTGRVEEALFSFLFIGESVNGQFLDDTNLDSIDRHILNIPINKLYSLELLLKERMVCHISQKLQEQMPLYAPAGFFLFYKER